MGVAAPVLAPDSTPQGAESGARGAASYARAMAGSRGWFFRRRILNEAIHQSWDWVRSRGAIHPGTIRAERFGSFGEGSLLGFPVATPLR